MRVNFTQMQRDLNSLQYNLGQLLEAVKMVEQAETNGQAVNAHDQVMTVTAKIKKSLFPFYNEIEETVSKSHGILYKKLKKEKFYAYED